MGGTPSRDTFDPNKGYTQVVFTAGSDVYDFELNEMQMLMQRLIKEMIGGLSGLSGLDNGVLMGSLTGQFVQVNSTINTIGVNPGFLFARGLPVLPAGHVDVPSPLVPDELVVFDGSETAGQINCIYYDVAEIPIDASIDPNIVDPIDGVESADRVQLVCTLKVNANATDVPTLVPQGHTFIKLGTVTKPSDGHTQLIPSDWTQAITVPVTPTVFEANALAASAYDLAQTSATNASAAAASASAAQASATAASTAASTAQTQATTAQTAASAASTAASNAVSAANTAVTTANAAQTTANAANALATTNASKIRNDAKGKLVTAEDSSSGAGLYVGSGKLGRWNGASWDAYFSSDGTFRVADGASNAGIFWNGTDLYARITAGPTKTAIDANTTAAANAQTTANSASSAASAAQTTANSAVSAAAAAQSTANSASTAASNAQSTANAAGSAASAAQTSADNAQNAANAAQSTANNAIAPHQAGGMHFYVIPNPTSFKVTGTLSGSIFSSQLNYDATNAGNPYPNALRVLFNVKITRTAAASGGDVAEYQFGDLFSNTPFVLQYRRDDGLGNTIVAGQCTQITDLGTSGAINPIPGLMKKGSASALSVFFEVWPVGYWK